MREVEEETGISIAKEAQVRFITATNDIFTMEGEGKHYVTIFVACKVEDDVEPKVSLRKTTLLRRLVSHPISLTLSMSANLIVTGVRAG